MIRVAYGSVPKDGGTYTFYRNMRPVLGGHGIDLRCVSIGRDQADLTEPAFVDEGCVLLAERTENLKLQAQAFCDWCEAERIDIVFGVNSPGMLSALPHLPERVRILARCANGFDEGYRLALQGYERLARIVALVPRLRDDLVERYGVDPDRIVLIPNGASPGRFDIAASKTRGTEERLELGFVGRLEHNQKGVMHLPAILERLDHLGVPYRLSIAGKGKHESELRDALATHIGADRARFMGTLSPDEIPAFMGRTDVLLFTSHFEGCPNALLEATMAGAVPVSWTLPGITDFIIRHGETGLLSDVGDTDAFAKAIAGLHADRERLAQMSKATAREARARFSTEVCGRAYTSLLSEVMSEPAPAWHPVPWSEFRVDPMFRRSAVSRIIPHRQREVFRAAVARLRGRLPRSKPDLVVAATPASSQPPRRLKVHQIINSADLRRGGAERLARSLHVALREAGVDARLVAIEACDLGDLEEAVSLGFASPYDPRVALRLASYARRIAQDDIVHVHLFPASAYLAALARTGRITSKLVFTEHSTSNRRRGTALGGVLDTGVYTVFDRIIAVSDGVKGELLSARPTLSDRTIVIANGSRLPFAEATTREKHCGPTRIVSVGRLVPAKNYARALDAVAGLPHDAFTYTIAGEGPERQVLEERAIRLGIGDRVEFAGYVSDIPALLRKSDIFLMPSAWDGFGLAAVEAMNATLPVVASDVPGLREVVGNDRAAGYLVNPMETGDIAWALRLLLADRELRDAMGRRGFERAKGFGMERFLSDHLKLYASLARQTADAA
jgi:glycosyltransferase involved in cell wall biosynthesis